MRGVRGPVAVLACSLVGLAVLLAGWPASEATAGPVALEEEIRLAEALMSANQQLRIEIERLDREIDALEHSDNVRQIEGLAAAVNELRAMNGAVAVVGPGIEITVSGGITAAAVRDLVNELKSAGAEAIAVNGHRLTTWSAFYDGQAGVVVDGHPLGDRMFIQAIGDPIVLREVTKRRGGFAAALEADGTRMEVTPRTGQAEVRLPVSLVTREFRMGHVP